MRSSSVAVASAVMIFLLVGWAVPVAAQLEIDAGAIRHDYSWGDSSQLEAESFELADGVTAALAGLPIDARAVLLGFPVAPGERADVEIERFDVYATSAKIWVVDEEGTKEIERSPRMHFLGAVPANPSVRLGLSLDPDGRNLTGAISHPAGFFELAELGSDGDTGNRPVYEVGAGMGERLGLDVSTSCGTPDHPQFFDPSIAFQGLESPFPTHNEILHQAVIAFDTDGEFVNDSLNYNGNTAEANTAIGNWVTNTNVIYERDLGLRLVQGDTVLRTNTATDPYVSSSTRDQLDEVGAWWEANKAGIPRVFVALLSGKGFSTEFSCSGAGIAWVDQYCDPVVSGGPFDGGSYSATQVLRCASLHGPGNVNLVGHEVGHNAGSGHTHCYSPPVDQCYNAGGAGCFGGTPVCPDHTAVIPGITAGKGTVMSYCNFGPPSGAGCGSSEPYFHPTVSARIKTSITANTGPTCVTHVESCSAGVDDLPVFGALMGPADFEACNSITFSNFSSSTTVTATAPTIEFQDNVTIGGTFTANSAVP